MIPWINFFVCILSSIFFLLFYVRSVRPAGRALIEGPTAYQKCYIDRLISGVFEGVITLNYILFLFFPLPCLPISGQFPWPWWISILIGLVIGIPSCWLMVKGARDAGEETVKPNINHTMYSGIYKKMRHPQATGEVFLFGVIGFLLNSPFLVLYSLVFFPIFIVLCYVEEQDLLLRFGQPYAEYCKHTGSFWPKRSI